MGKRDRGKKKDRNEKKTGEFSDTDRKNKYYTTKNNLKMKNEIQIENGWLLDERTILSPHYDLRPSDTEISLLVIHYITLPPEQFVGGSIDDFFPGPLDPPAHPFFSKIYQIPVAPPFFFYLQGQNPPIHLPLLTHSTPPRHPTRA
ncbi:hypothetical protein ACEE49_11290, partial [[Pasteurella] aerogenes]